MDYEPLDMSGKQRGCGSREPGGIYAEIKLRDDGRGVPINEFLWCEPKALKMDLTANGVNLVQVKGVWHIFDWIGENHYPTVSDFYTEGAMDGFSRKLPSTLKFERLTSESLMYFVHAKARVLNASDLQEPVIECRKCRRVHTASEGTVLSACWETFGKMGEHDFSRDGVVGEWNEDRTFRRVLANGMRYDARLLSTEHPGAEFEPGIFMGHLPLTGIAVVKHSDEELMAERLSKVGESELPSGIAEA